MRARRRAPTRRSPSIERMNGFHCGYAAKSVRTAQTRSALASMTVSISSSCRGMFVRPPRGCAYSESIHMEEAICRCHAVLRELADAGLSQLRRSRRAQRDESRPRAGEIRAQGVSLLLKRRQNVGQPDRERQSIRLMEAILQRRREML